MFLLQWLYVLKLEAYLLSVFNFFHIFIQKKMRKSPWIGFRMVSFLYCIKVSFVVLLRLLNWYCYFELEKSNATGLNDQKANIEAGESESDDKDKSDS